MLAGSRDKIEKVVADPSTLGMTSRPRIILLNVDMANHSEHMKTASEKFIQNLPPLNRGDALFPVFSNVTSEHHDYASETISAHMCCSVRFVECVENMYRDGARIFVEFGPKCPLSRMVGDILTKHDDVYLVKTNNSKQNSDLTLRLSAMKCCVVGVSMSNFDPWTPPPRRGTEGQWVE